MHILKNENPTYSNPWTLKPHPLLWLTCTSTFSPSQIYLLQWANARPASSDNRSGRHPPEKASWSWGWGVLGQFMKKGCNYGSKPRGGLNYAWLNKAQGYRQAMFHQTALLWSSWLLEEPTRGKKKKKPKKKQTGTQLLINQTIVLWHAQALWKTKLLRCLQNNAEKRNIPIHSRSSDTSQSLRYQ